MPGCTALAPKIDRQTTTPFLLRLFYKHNAFNRLEEFAPGARLPPSLQIYTWQSCTLRELSTLLLTALPNLIQKPYPGTRIAFRLVYADLASMGRSGMSGGRYVSRELGSIVIGGETSPSDSDEEDAVKHEDRDGGDENPTDEPPHTNGDANSDPKTSPTINSTSEALSHLTGGEPDKTLQDARFVIGDYICAAILPPLPDGSVQAPPPPPTPSGPSMRGPDGYVPRGPGGRDGGYGGARGGRGGSRFSLPDDRRGPGVPHGEWRRGEAPPERERDGDRGDFGGGGGAWRGGGGGYRGGSPARGRGRW